MAINLGDVTIGLRINTEQLQSAVGKLQEFAKTVDRYSRMSSESAAQTTRVYANQEKVLNSLLTRVSQMITRHQEMGGSSSVVNNLSKAYSELTNILTKGEVSQHRLNRAIEFGKRVLAQANEESKREAQQRATAVNTATLQAEAYTKLIALTRQISGSKLGPDVQMALLRESLQTYDKYGQAVEAAAGKQNLLKKAKAEYAMGLAEVRAMISDTTQLEKKHADALKASSAAAVALTKAQEAASRAIMAGGRGGASGTQAEADHLQRVNQLYRQYVAAVTAAADNKSKIQLLTAQYNRNLTNSIASLNAAATAQKNNTKAQQDALTVQRMLVDAQTKVQNLNLTANRRVGASAAPYVEANQKALLDYERALNSAKGSTAALGLEKARFGKVLSDNAALINHTARSGTGLVGMFRKMEEAAVLSFGPLSGVGARLNIIATMMEQMPWKTFAFLAGMTAITTVLVLLTKAAIQATIQFERWEAQMLVATGTQITVGRTMQQVITFANQYGQALDQVIPAYAKFAASARLAGVSLKDQNALFEATVKTAAALRLPEEGIQRMFLAFEQMAAKGTVMTEEIKRQLGDVLPGAVELGAKAMGMSIAQFMKALKDQEVQFSVFAPRFAKLLNEVFGEAAQQGALSTQAQIVRLSNTWLLFNRTLDQNTKASTAFKDALAALTAGIQWATNNMQGIISAIAALGAGLATAVGLWTSLRAIILAVTAAKAALAVATINLNAAIAATNILMMATPVGRLIALFGTLAAAIMAAYWAKTKFNSAFGLEVDKTEQDILRLEMGAKVFARSGKVLHETMTSSLSEAGEVFAEISSRYDEAVRKQAETARKIEALDAIIGTREPPKRGFGREPENIKQARLDRARLMQELKDNESKINAYYDQMERVRGIYDRMASMPTETINLGGKVVDDKAQLRIESFRDTIQGIIEDAKTAQRTLEVMLSGGSPEELRWLDALNKAGDVLRKMPKEFGGDRLTAMLKEYAREGESVVQTLGRLIHNTREADRAQREYTNFIESFDDRVRSVTNAMQVFSERADEASTVTAEWRRTLVAAEKELLSLEDKIRDVFKGSTYSRDEIQTVVDYMLGEARSLQEVNFAAHWRREFKQVSAFMGEESAAIKEKFAKLIEAVNMNLLFNGGDAVEAGQRIGRLINMMNQEIEQLKIQKYFGDLTQTIKSWEQQTTDAFLNILRTGKSSFKELFEAIAWDMMKLTIQRGITQPLFDSLFGSLSNANIFGGGLIGEFLANLMPANTRQNNFKANSPNTYSMVGNSLGSATLGGLFNKAWDSFGNWFINTFGMASGGRFSPGQPYLVGEEGPELLVPDGPGSIWPKSRTLAAMREGSGSRSVSVNVHNYGRPVQTEASVSETPGGVVVDLILREVAADIRRNGRVGAAMQQQYGLNRAIGLSR